MSIHAPVPGSDEWARAQVASFKARRDDYQLMASTLEQVLRCVAAKVDQLAIVQARVKAVPSFAGKIRRKSRKLMQSPVDELTDLCGGRIIVHTASDVKRVVQYLDEHFEIDRGAYHASRELGTTEFGYRSVHRIVSFRRDSFPTKGVPIDVPSRIFDMKNQRAEVQVRTMVQHAWADVNHDTAYKGSFTPPVPWQRRLAIVAALLEEADAAFSQLVDGLREYATRYGSYMTAGELRKSMENLEFVLEQDPSNLQVIAEIGTMALALSDWDKAINVLGTAIDSCNVEDSDPAILRNLGVALCAKHARNRTSADFTLGQQYLSWSIGGESSALSICSLADTYREADQHRAAELYLMARQVDPADPTALQGYLECEIATTRDTRALKAAGPDLARALERCHGGVDVGVDLIETYLHIGALSLLSAKSDEALRAYAKAVSMCESSLPITEALQSLRRIAPVAHEVSGYECASRLLLLALAIKFRDPQGIAEVQALASTTMSAIVAPVVILAGNGTDDGMAAQCHAIVLRAFEGFRGTAMSGGTCDGVARLAGDIGEAAHRKGEAVVTIGYVPTSLPAEVHGDCDSSRYAHIELSGAEGFSPLESLQGWTDIVAAGIPPSDVTLVGIGGGAISSVEYRVALALGATVGIVDGTGRSADEILYDEAWMRSEKLVRLPMDAETLRYFIRPVVDGLPDELCDLLAPAIHERHRQDVLRQRTPDDPALVAWSHLPEHLKLSNAMQAQDYANKLRLAGYGWERIDHRPINRVSLTTD